MAVLRRRIDCGILKFREEEESRTSREMLKTRENEGKGREKKGLPGGGNPLLIFF